jgi:2-dehydro-3-deoxyglucarate aldolase
MVVVFAAAKAASKPVGILSPVEADARRYLDMGASYVAVGSDLGVLRMGTQALADKYRSPDVAVMGAQY